VLALLTAFWFSALAVTTSMFLAVVVVQSVDRQVRGALRAARRSTPPTMLPATSAARVDSGARAA
jgi:hypothetical protein